MATSYVIRGAGRQPVYLQNFGGAHYSWTVSQKGACRFSRADAISTAVALDVAIRANGYSARPVRVAPASGGMEIIRQEVR